MTRVTRQADTSYSRALSPAGVSKGIVRQAPPAVFADCVGFLPKLRLSRCPPMASGTEGRDKA